MLPLHWAALALFLHEAGAQSVRHLDDRVRLTWVREQMHGVNHAVEDQLNVAQCCTMTSIGHEGCAERSSQATQHSTPSQQGPSTLAHCLQIEHIALIRVHLRRPHRLLLLSEAAEILSQLTFRTVSATWRSTHCEPVSFSTMPWAVRVCSRCAQSTSPCMQRQLWQGRGHVPRLHCCSCCRRHPTQATKTVPALALLLGEGRSLRPLRLGHFVGHLVHKLLQSGFLGHNHIRFGPVRERCCVHSVWATCSWHVRQLTDAGSSVPPHHAVSFTTDGEYDRDKLCHQVG